MTIGFFAYAIVNFALFFLRTSGQPHPPPPDSVWRGFSGHWMLFYCAGLTVATTAFLHGVEPSGAVCRNGHRMSPGDLFCSRCGAPIKRP